MIVAGCAVRLVIVTQFERISDEQVPSAVRLITLFDSIKVAF